MADQLHTPGVEPSLPEEGGNFLLALLSDIYNATDGPRTEDFELGNSRVPLAHALCIAKVGSYPAEFVGDDAAP